jgi:amino acid transporter
LTFSATITAAIPIIVKSIFSNISFTPWFIGALAAFIVLVIIGILGMKKGAIALLHPQILYDKYLHCSHWEFQQRVLYWAGKHFSKNKAIIDAKALFRDIMIVILLIEILCFILWVVV